MRLDIRVIGQKLKSCAFKEELKGYPVDFKWNMRALTFSRFFIMILCFSYPLICADKNCGVQCQGISTNLIYFINKEVMENVFMI